MTFRPKTYSEARSFLLDRKHKDRNWRAVSYDGRGRDIRDQIIGLTGDPADIEAGTCEIAFRQWGTNIVVFYSDGEHAEVNGFNSVTTNERLREMGMPTCKEMNRNNLGLKVELLCQRERLVDYPGWRYHNYSLGTPGLHVVLIRTPNGWLPDEDHPGNYLVETLQVPKPGLRKTFTNSKRALRRCLKVYVDMVEALHGEITPHHDYNLHREVVSLRDDVVVDMFNGWGKREWQQWMDTAPEEHGAPVLNMLYNLLGTTTFWSEAGPEHFDRNQLPTRAVGDRLNEYANDL